MKSAKLLKLLYVQVLVGLVLGIAVGHWWPEFGAALTRPAAAQADTERSGHLMPAPRRLP